MELQRYNCSIFISSCLVNFWEYDNNFYNSGTYIMSNGKFYLCHRKGKKIMKGNQGLGKHLFEEDLQQIGPAEIKEVATR